jgi:hypothetical protein
MINSNNRRKGRKNHKIGTKADIAGIEYEYPRAIVRIGRDFA